MIFFNPIVISNKIQHNNSLLKAKSFAASFGVHATLLAALAYFGTTHPIPLPKAEESVRISLSDFTSDIGDIQRLESPNAHHVPKPVSKPLVSSTSKISKPITTPEGTSSLTPSMSPEASAPLAVSHTASSQPLSQKVSDSPHLTSNTPVNELPRNPVSRNEVGGAALGHIRAMIENAITYPSIARKLRIEGVVLVTFTLKSDGTVDAAHIKSTSGSSLLDEKAIQTILSLSGDFPSLGQTFELSIPIAFSLHKS